MKKLTIFFLLFLFAFALQGQKIIMNEGKVIRAYDTQTPLNVPDVCEFWIEGKQASSFILDGTSVDRWWDLSGNDRHCNNTNDDATRPTWDSLTGRITFTSANSTFLQSAAFGSALIQPNTIFVVYKITGALNNTYIVFDGITTGDRNTFYCVSNNFGITSGTGIESTADANDNIHCGLFNGVSGEFWINGISVANGDVGAKGLTGITLGALWTSGAVYADCQISEVIVYNADISDVSRDKITGYLADKWGITATTDFKGYILRQD